jgi:hypothetical protein
MKAWIDGADNVKKGSPPPQSSPSASAIAFADSRIISCRSLFHVCKMRVPSPKVVQQAAFFIKHLVSPKLDAVVHDKTREHIPI